jgi:hypothetical protein
VEPEIIRPHKLSEADDLNEEALELLESIDSKLDDLVELLAGIVQVIHQNGVPRGRDPIDSLADIARNVLSRYQTRRD